MGTLYEKSFKELKMIYFNLNKKDILIGSHHPYYLLKASKQELIDKLTQ